MPRPNPRDYAEPVVLRDGGSLVVRALRATDKQALLDLFHRLSQESIWHRTFGAKSVLTEKELRYLTEIDFIEHVALAAVVREDSEEVIIAVGRYCCLARKEDGGRRAELALAVADAHQGRGVGTLLLEHL